MRYHFSGIAGAGMNPLAQLMRARGHPSRAPTAPSTRARTATWPPGSPRSASWSSRRTAPRSTADLDRFVYSTAVEAETPEVRAARAHGIERVPRPALLAEVVTRAPRRGHLGHERQEHGHRHGRLAHREAGRPATVLGGAALVGEGGTGASCRARRRARGRGGLRVRRHAHRLSSRAGPHPQREPRSRRAGRAARRSSRRSRSAVRPALRQRGLLRGAPIGRASARGRSASAPARTRASRSRARAPSRARRAHLEGGALALDLPQPGAHNLENAAAAALSRSSSAWRPRR